VLQITGGPAFRNSNRRVRLKPPDHSVIALIIRYWGRCARSGVLFELVRSRFARGKTGDGAVVRAYKKEVLDVTHWVGAVKRNVEGSFMQLHFRFGGII